MIIRFILRLKNKLLKKDYIYYENLDETKYKKSILEWYYIRAGKKLDLDCPKTFNEKINYLKLNEPTDLMVKLADKYRMREYIKNEFGEDLLVKLISDGSYKKFDDINFNKLPKKFVLKCNHGSGFNCVVTNKKNINYNDLKNKFDNWMNTNYTYYSRGAIERQYENIPRRILCEEYLGDNLIDIQCWCSEGKILFISYIKSPHGENYKQTFDENWNQLNFVTSLPILEENIEMPSYLPRIIEISKKVSKKFKFIRVDFYITEKNELKISEFTFTPAAGCIKWVPENADVELGKLINL